MQRPESRQELLEAILARATTDRQFRSALLNDPAGAIRNAFGVEIPADYRLRFIERDPDVDALVVLPPPAFREKTTPFADLGPRNAHTPPRTAEEEP